MVGTLSDEQIDELIGRSLFARLGCHADGRTYIVPVSFAYDGKRLVGGTTDGQKVDIMRKNPSVCIQLDEIKSLMEWQSVILQGRFRELQGLEASEAMGQLIDRYGPVFEEEVSGARRGRDFTPARLDGQPVLWVVYAIEIIERSGRYERA